MAVKKTITQKRAAQRVPPLPDLYYSVSSFLHTVRSIAHHEDELCTLLHEIKQARQVDSRLAGELTAILNKLPSVEYMHDFRTLETSLDASSFVKSGAAEKSATGKRSVAQKKARKAR